MTQRDARYEAQTLGGVADLIKEKHSTGLYAFCMNPKCKRRPRAVRLDHFGLIRRLGPNRRLRDVLITCSKCALDGCDRTLTNIAVGMRVENQ